MFTLVFDEAGICLEKNEVEPQPSEAAFRTNYPDATLVSVPPTLIPKDMLTYSGDEVVYPPVVELSSNNESITADGTDEATVTVTVSGADPLPASIEVDINGLVETVALTNGVGALDPISAESPCDIDITAVDQDTYWDGGGLVVGAV